MRRSGKQRPPLVDPRRPPPRLAQASSPEDRRRPGAPPCGASRSSAPGRATALATRAAGPAGSTRRLAADTSPATFAPSAPSGRARQNIRPFAAIPRATDRGTPADPDVATAAQPAQASTARPHPAGRHPTTCARAPRTGDTPRSAHATGARCGTTRGFFRSSRAHVAPTHGPRGACAATSRRTAEHAGPAAHHHTAGALSSGGHPARAGRVRTNPTARVDDRSAPAAGAAPTTPVHATDPNRLLGRVGQIRLRIEQAPAGDQRRRYEQQDPPGLHCRLPRCDPYRASSDTRRLTQSGTTGISVPQPRCGNLGTFSAPPRTPAETLHPPRSSGSTTSHGKPF